VVGVFVLMSKCGNVVILVLVSKCGNVVIVVLKLRTSTVLLSEDGSEVSCVRSSSGATQYNRLVGRRPRFRL
jgi:hypothetical protein